MSDSDLAALYKLVVSVDTDLTPKKDMDFEFNSIRSRAEDEWKADPETAVDRAFEVDLKPVEIGALAKSLDVASADLAEWMTGSDRDFDDDDILDAVDAYGPEAVEEVRLKLEQGPSIQP